MGVVIRPSQVLPIPLGSRNPYAYHPCPPPFFPITRGDLNMVHNFDSAGQVPTPACSHTRPKPLSTHQIAACAFHRTEPSSPLNRRHKLNEYFEIGMCNRVLNVFETRDPFIRDCLDAS
jgi:hypothetical protein